MNSTEARLSAEYNKIIAIGKSSLICWIMMMVFGFFANSICILAFAMINLISWWASAYHYQGIYDELAWIDNATEYRTEYSSWDMIFQMVVTNTAIFIIVLVKNIVLV